MTQPKGNSFNIFNYGITYDGYITRKYDKVYDLPNFTIYENELVALIYLKAIKKSVLLSYTGKYKAAIYNGNMYVLETDKEPSMSIMNIDELHYFKIGRKISTTNMKNAIQSFCECPIIPEKVVYPVLIYDRTKWPYKVNRKAYNDIMFNIVE